jgi:fatty acid desaturase
MTNTRIKNTYSFIFPLKILLLITLQSLAIVCIVANSLPLKFFGFLLFGIMNAHTIQIIHQCSHFTGFKSKRLNNLTGQILGLFVFIDFKTYRLEHFEHHKNLGTQKDSEFFGFDRITNPLFQES